MDARLEAQGEAAEVGRHLGQGRGGVGPQPKGRAMKANSSGASKMPAATVREYRSLICAGSKPVSAIGKA